MEKGHLRCDANVSVRLQRRGKVRDQGRSQEPEFVPLSEMALDYEIERQVELIEIGRKVIQETRLYDVERGETVGMRSKEQAHDYRYFPEPDLVPLRVSEHWLNEVKRRLAGTAGATGAPALSGIWLARVRCASA